MEPNQVLIISKKKQAKEYGDGNWSYFSFQGIFKAQKELSKVGFALYLFFLRDAPNFQRALYRVEFEKLTGYKKTAYYKGLHELKEKGYLARPNNMGCSWYFYPDL